MISDSPYEFRESVLAPREGAIAGLLGAAVILGLLAALEPVSRFPTVSLLRQLAFVAFPGCRQACTEPRLMAAGLAVLCFLGVLAGLLHAVSQQRIPAFGLLAVGIFYGTFLWVASGLVAAPVGGIELKRMVKSWPWLSASLCYGIWLSLVCAWVQGRRPVVAGPVSPD